MGKSRNEKSIMSRLAQWLLQEKKLVIFLGVTACLMFCSIVWVYHIKVLNAPKVYSDGFGYFAYLPALLYKDFSFGFIEKENWEHSLKLIEAAGGLVNKYPVGVAILESPFFFAAHLLSLLRDALIGRGGGNGNRIFQSVSVYDPFRRNLLLDRGNGFALFIVVKVSSLFKEGIAAFLYRDHIWDESVSLCLL